jgi:hypothetical protein
VTRKKAEHEIFERREKSKQEKTKKRRKEENENRREKRLKVKEKEQEHERMVALRPHTPKHIRDGWSHYIDTSEPVVGYWAQVMVTVHSGFRISDLSITDPATR